MPLICTRKLLRSSSSRASRKVITTGMWSTSTVSISAPATTGRLNTVGDSTAIVRYGEGPLIVLANPAAVPGKKAPVHSLDEIIASGKFDPSVQNRLLQAQKTSPEGPDSDACKAEAAYREAFGAAVTKVMDDQRLDALVSPTRESRRSTAAERTS